MRGLILRCHNAKTLFIGGIPTVGCQAHNLDMLYAGCRRRMLRKRGNKSIERIGIHKRPHADALHNARYMDMRMSHATLLR